MNSRRCHGRGRSLAFFASRSEKRVQSHWERGHCADGAEAVRDSSRPVLAGRPAAVVFRLQNIACALVGQGHRRSGEHPSRRKAERMVAWLQSSIHQVYCSHLWRRRQTRQGPLASLTAQWSSSGRTDSTRNLLSSTLSKGCGPISFICRVRAGGDPNVPQTRPLLALRHWTHLACRC